MGFLPLVPSAHPSAWIVEPDATGREEAIHATFERDAHACRFCGHRSDKWQEVFHLDGDHMNWSAENLVTACTLCHAAQHLGRPAVEREAVLIWLPDVSQAALNTIVRRIHLILYAHDEPAHVDEPPRSEEAPVHEALSAYRALLGEARTLEGRIHTSSPRELGAALLEIAAKGRERPDRLLGGIRLLHRGRHFRNGHDVYPQILSGWAASAAA